jgi:hypothetical protein
MLTLNLLELLLFELYSTLIVVGLNNRFGIHKSTTFLVEEMLKLTKGIFIAIFQESELKK